MERGILSMMIPPNATAPSPGMSEVNPWNVTAAAPSLAAENWLVFLIVAPFDSLLNKPMDSICFFQRPEETAGPVKMMM